MPSPVGGLGACPREKNQFCVKNYAILSKFWYFFPILQHKVGDYPPVPKVGDLSPCPPPAPTLMAVDWPVQLQNTQSRNVISSPCTPLDHGWSSFFNNFF